MRIRVGPGLMVFSPRSPSLTGGICSAAYFPDDFLESVVAGAIFASGASGVDLGHGNRKFTRPCMWHPFGDLPSGLASTYPKRLPAIP
jgi:hypothetical protein